MNYTSHMLAAMETVECITILVTYAHDILTRHWYQKLVSVSCNLVPDFSGTSFWNQIEHVLFNARIW